MTLTELGTRICIMGPSNSGKSTLAQAIAKFPGAQRCAVRVNLFVVSSPLAVRRRKQTLEGPEASRGAASTETKNSGRSRRGGTAAKGTKGRGRLAGMRATITRQDTPRSL